MDMGITKHYEKHKGLFIIFLILSPMLFSFIILSVPTVKAQSAYTADSSVTYEFNETIFYQSNDVGPSSIKLWTAQINNWTDEQPSNVTTLQQSDLMGKSLPINMKNYSYDPYDIYNNSYEYMEKNFIGAINPDNSLRYSSKYRLTLYSRDWEIPESVTLENYDTNSNLYKFYTKAQPYCESNDSLIVSTAMNLRGTQTSVVQIAKMMYMFVVTNMTYQIQEDSLGAKQALVTKKGDCSEYSSLMVALLRASGIPARKVLGIGIVQGDIAQRTPNFKPIVDDEFNYTFSTIPGHAWMQYYVPNYGWITCDPTWGQAYYEGAGEQMALEYFNKIDFCHLITSIGDYYEEGIDPPLEDGSQNPTGVAEFSYIYLLHTPVPHIFDSRLTFKVVATNIIVEPSQLDRILNMLSEMDLFSWIVIIGIFGVIIAICYYAVRPRKSTAFYAKM